MSEEAAATRPVRIDVWSDFVCPFCVLEEPVLEQAAGHHGADVTIAWRAYELRPEPVPTLEPDGEYLRSIWERAVYPMAEQRGMPLRLPPVQPRSRLAHEAEHHARRQGFGDPMRRAIFRAFFEDGRDIGRPEVLLDIGAAIGLDVGRLQGALTDGSETALVLADEREAIDLGIRGVPAMLIRPADAPAGAKRAPSGVLVSGAQPFGVLQQAIEHVRAGQ